MYDETMRGSASVDVIRKRFLAGYNADGTTPYSALTYRADVGYLLGIIERESGLRNKAKEDLVNGQ